MVYVGEIVNTHGIKGELRIISDFKYKDDVFTPSKKLYLGCKTSIIPADDSITSIGDSAFSGAAGLKKVVIPDCVTSIDYGAFENCTGLKSLIIGKGLNHIDNYAFINCSSLETIEVDEGNSTYYSEGNCLIETFNQKLFLGTSLSEIPNTVTSIGEKAFYGNTSLVSINIPESITSIGGSAFWGCTNLSKVNITNIVKWCGIVFEYADSNPLRTGAELYLNNQLITKLVIPNDVTRIENYAFYNNSNLTSVTFGSGIVYIGEDAFYGCICAVQRGIFFRKKNPQLYKKAC